MIDSKVKTAQTEMWNTIMGVCSKKILSDVAANLTGRALGSIALLAELIRIDLKSRADPR